MFKDQLRKFEQRIMCNKCGVCCGDCPARSGNLCEAHPAVVGKAKAGELRSAACGLTPVQLTMYFDIAGPPVVQFIEKKFKISLVIAVDMSGVPKITSFARRG